METQTSFAVYLKEELLRRKEHNPSYSLRAFAKSLGLSSSFLSKVLQAKKSVSSNTLLKITSRLKTNDEMTQSFLADLNHQSLPLLEFESVAVDQFQLIADWYHFAMIEAVTLHDFDSTPEWFAQRLGITQEQAHSALQRLLRLGYLRSDANGRILAESKNNTTVGYAPPTAANREHERQLLGKAIEALDQLTPEHRSQTSMTMAIPSARLKEAKTLISRFRRDLTALMQRKGKRDSVYQLSVAFFPLTEPTNKNKANLTTTSQKEKTK